MPKHTNTNTRRLRYTETTMEKRASSREWSSLLDELGAVEVLFCTHHAFICLKRCAALTIPTQHFVVQHHSYILYKFTPHLTRHLVSRSQEELREKERDKLRQRMRQPDQGLFSDELDNLFQEVSSRGVPLSGCSV